MTKYKDFYNTNVLIINRNFLVDELLETVKGIKKSKLKTKKKKQCV